MAEIDLDMLIFNMYGTTLAHLVKIGVPVSNEGAKFFIVNYIGKITSYHRQ